MQVQGVLAIFPKMMVVFGYQVAAPRLCQLRLVNWPSTAVDAKICRCRKSILGDVAESQQCSNCLMQL